MATPHPTKDRILLEAARLFATKGYESTSIQDLARALRLSKAALYHHFRGKEEVLLEISRQALEGLLQATEEAAIHPDPREALRAFMEAHARYLEEHHAFFVAMLQGQESLAPESRQKTLPLRDRYEERLRSILRRGMEQGLFRPLDPALAGRAILGMLNWMIRWFHPGGPLSAQEVARFYFDLVWQGLASRGP